MVTIDAANFESVNDEATDTTHYGGSVTVSQTLLCSGTDRDSENVYDRIIDAACALLGVKPSDADSESFERFYSEVMAKVDNGERFGIGFADDEFTVE